MSSVQRIGHIALGLLMIIGGMMLFALPDSGVSAVAVMLGVALLVYGFRQIIYYFTMARHMVGGYALLFVGIIAIDAGAFVLTLLDEPRMAIVLYLVVSIGFAGLVRILRSMENRRIGSSWVPLLLFGIVSILFAALCVALMSSDADTLTGFILLIGLFATGLRHIVWAFRRTDVAFIQ